MKKPISPTQKMLNVWAIILIVWSVYRTTFKTDLPIWFDEFIAKPVIFLAPLAYYIAHVEMKPLLERLDITLRTIRSEIMIGIAGGSFFLIAGYLASSGVLHTNRTDMGFTSQPLILASIILISAASSISEEVLSRGFVLKRLFEESHNVLTSVLISSLLFFFLHIPILFSNPMLRGQVLLQLMATDLLLSFAVSLIYLQRRSVVSAIIIHALYNISVYLFIS